MSEVKRYLMNGQPIDDQRWAKGGKLEMVLASDYDAEHTRRIHAERAFSAMREAATIVLRKYLLQYTDSQFIDDCLMELAAVIYAERAYGDNNE